MQSVNVAQEAMCYALTAQSIARDCLWPVQKEAAVTAPSLKGSSAQ